MPKNGALQMQQSLFCKKEFRAEITKNDASELQLC